MGLQKVNQAAARAADAIERIGQGARRPDSTERLALNVGAALTDAVDRQQLPELVAALRRNL